MLLYTDPTATGFLNDQNALGFYGQLLDRLYHSAAKDPDSAFTWLEAFDDVPPDQVAELEVRWLAFPLTADASHAEIDLDRFSLQDEYIEWHVERDANGRILRIVFTTEFPEFYQALAAVSFDALAAGIAEVIEGADPTPRALFGTDHEPAQMSASGRAKRFLRNLPANPWNDGTNGILCLTQGANTLGALVGLLGECAKKRTDVAPEDTCANVGDACMPGRSSDPFVCTAAQRAARQNQAISLADPAGIQILSLTGIWDLAGQQIDVNDPASNQGVWKIERNARRATLEVRDDLQVDGSAIESGAQVATKLQVGAKVLAAADADLPEWARAGFEFLGRGGTPA